MGRIARRVGTAGPREARLFRRAPSWFRSTSENLPLAVGSNQAVPRSGSRGKETLVSWETDYLDELIAEHGEDIAVVWIGREDFNPCPFEELPEVLDEWIAKYAIPFSRSARAAAFRGLRSALEGGVGVPLIYLGPGMVRLRWYQPDTRFGPWVWGYSEN